MVGKSDTKAEAGLTQELSSSEFGFEVIVRVHQHCVCLHCLLFYETILLTINVNTVEHTKDR